MEKAPMRTGLQTANFGDANVVILKNIFWGTILSSYVSNL